MITVEVIKIFLLATIAFLIALSGTPLLTYFLYHYKLGKQIRQSAPIYFALHKHKSGVPSMGGIMIWSVTLLLAILFAILPRIFEDTSLDFLNFLSRSETLLPLGALVAAALIGLLDDFLSVIGFGGKKEGIRFRYKFILYTLIALWGALWFYFKLDWDIIHIPFDGDISLGLWFIPFFILVIVATSFAVNETDGLDGLAGGVLLTNFAAFGAIAFVSGKYELASFCAVIAGALLAFLWFNIPPARFFMGDTGSMALGTLLGVIAFYLKSVFVLPVIGMILVLEALSVILQLASRKFRGKKLFLSSPLHHHFEVKGWQEPKIVMRFWLISLVCSMLGLILVLLDRTI
ncbi:MAG: Phospho-N-acetylmuramoyl-pentapeptide-transferase [Parcubacteria group bacterium GW2011_GWC2_44_17]|uniref:Phospho-N-acetylmuramoyl-pentapeptide-transferase n=1 Tax=Candidatus Jacksonbacteria bacterium RIFCSPLOWO2_02_FULL_44_20 TaxID=1798460 RepID=A0A1G2A7N8_9BACT|nr:MAG: Phospho-N-acetylmuramoyl-pentapeptide-transferase [Parcubacteria group bacterium GW2011_GWC2_44_17]KKT48267.1 MAG: Phospho-N-acetylmuramoyl-pentapeptide-transferase [Parcubacteria group bacterium GW2011_GWF2_44_17]OGY70403.1 MAG: phospho-N-acetylmuramoyl-pentapeptide-transferase [Candidatus Jacksonbacteria bacterium RIFCSPHIGHO2_12_FULL_44_12]OGY71183.1 MAG: phospho-N-acetylmuramoyl-pentapeptide-transferase [Candidatus Jacksonbacteria bacterium RIFCSPHIGHO2_02_FULL_44_25]OGY72908.1 MAG: